MRKLFSLFAAALIAFSVSAKVVHITPTAPRAQDNIRYALRDSLTADTIMLAEGTYIEANSIAGDRNIVIMPEEGAKPVVQLATGAYIKVQNGANVVVEGLKFDGATNGTNYGLRPYDASNSTLKVKGCEFYGFTKNIITADGAQHMSSLIIDDCYFHDNTRAAVYFAASQDTEGSNICDYLEVKNTTIANVSALSGAGAIDIRNNNANQSAETVTLIIDHCTFYNIQGYERVVQSYKSPLVTISNSIFMQPETTTNYAIWAYGGNVKNCLAYNFAGNRDWDACPTFVNMLNVDPLFVDAANGNFTLGEGSPALTAAEDGGAIGDPRWVPAVAPAHTYTVAGGSTDLFGTAWDPANAANDMVLQEDNTYKWEKIDLTLAAGTIEFKVCEDHAWTNCWPAQNYQLSIAESGIYTISIYYNPNDNNYVGAVANKTGDAVVIPTVAMHGDFLGSWADTENFTVAEGDATASLTLNLAVGNYEFGMRIGGSGNWTANGATLTREANSTDVSVGSGNMKLIADLAGDYIFTYTFETNTLAVTFPIGTGITNTAVDAQIIKTIENGQLIIIKNGVKYDVHGTIIR